MDTCATDFKLIGILNVTPDSFFDGGRHPSCKLAVEHARQLELEGAHGIDIGGASSRPGAAEVSVAEELLRVIPVVKQVKKEYAGFVSVDTTWSNVALQALEAGATWINDISAGRFDPDMIKVVADSRCTIVLMHSRGTPQTMQQQTAYTDVTGEVADELSRSVEKFLAAGVRESQIIIDPGIGFAKTAEQCIVVLREIDRILRLGFPVLLGTSRKSFIGQITGKQADGRLPGSLGSIAQALLAGVTYFRVHDVGATRDFFNVLTALR